ncbi:Aste57867_25526 [Aphanomyces stellatus]|uniref:Aste57867_25526 protein n=1 Tax=Aphanomyces stellatus TaxID=120398 RepID=A0A485LVT3_9STRA|nr:hypothetical protein As57867_025447 [Aphanomyces stellatus]VFU02149.1 Aste57867_25526 [Aphanomyces stellatus]
MREGRKEAVESLERKRVWARDYRRVQNEHRAYLKAKLADLTRVLATKTQPLPWQEITLALQEDSVEAHRTNKQLKHQVREGERLLRRLQTWISSHEVRSLAPQYIDWRQHAVLCDSGEARLLNLAWLTERMYHNANMALAQHERFGSTKACLIEANDILAYVVRRSESVVHATLAECTQTNRKMYFQDLGAKNQAPLEKENLARAFGDDILYAHRAKNDSACLYRLFQTPKRSVLVSSTVHHDGALPTPLNEILPWLHWIVMDEIDASTTRITKLIVATLRPLESAAQYSQWFGMNVDELCDDDRFDAHKRIVVESLEKSHWTSERTFFETLATLQRQHNNEEI